MVENMPGNSTSATLPLFSSDKPYSITWLYQRWRLSVYIKRLLLQSPYYPPSSWTIYSVESSLFPCQSHGACMNQSSGYLQPLNPYSLVDISQIHKTWRNTWHLACVYCLCMYFDTFILVQSLFFCYSSQVRTIFSSI